MTVGELAKRFRLVNRDPLHLSEVFFQPDIRVADEEPLDAVCLADGLDLLTCPVVEVAGLLIVLFVPRKAFERAARADDRVLVGYRAVRLLEDDLAPVRASSVLPEEDRVIRPQLAAEQNRVRCILDAGVDDLHLLVVVDLLDDAAQDLVLHDALRFSIPMSLQQARGEERLEELSSVHAADRSTTDRLPAIVPDDVLVDLTENVRGVETVTLQQGRHPRSGEDVAVIAAREAGGIVRALLVIQPEGLKPLECGLVDVRGVTEREFDVRLNLARGDERLLGGQAEIGNLLREPDGQGDDGLNVVDGDLDAQGVLPVWGLPVARGFLSSTTPSYHTDELYINRY